MGECFEERILFLEIFDMVRFNTRQRLCEKMVKRGFIMSTFEPLENIVVMNILGLIRIGAVPGRYLNYRPCYRLTIFLTSTISAQTHFRFWYGSREKFCPIDLKFGELVEDT